MPKIIKTGMYQGKKVAQLDDGKIIQIEPDALEKVTEDIAERGTFQESIKKNVESGYLGKGIAALQVAGAPISLPLSGVANAELAMARGDFKGIPSEFMQGLTGQKQGNMADVYKASDVPVLSNPIVAGAADFLANVSGGMAMAKGVRALLPMATSLNAPKKQLIEKGAGLIENTAEAIKYKGAQVGKAYEAVKDIKVEPLKIMRAMPEYFRTQFDDYAKELYKTDFMQLVKQGNVEALRKMKMIFGKLNPSRFGQEAGGKDISMITDLYNKSYGQMRELLKDSLKNVKNGNKLFELDNQFSELSKAEDIIQKTILDPTTGWATKVGGAAKKLKSKDDVTFQYALDVLKKSGVKVNKAKKAVDAMNDFVLKNAISNTAKSVLRYTTLGGAAGAAGSSAVRNVGSIGQGE